MSDGLFSPRILVVGCGGIGGIVSACLLDQGYSVTPLTRNQQIADAINTRGFVTHGDVVPGTVPGSALVSLHKNTAPFDYILMATQPPQVEEALRSVAHHLADDGIVVCFQNGLCEPRLAEIVGEERVVGAIIAWGALMSEPGHYDRTSAGGFTLGHYRPNGDDDPRLERLAWILEAIGPVTRTTNLMGARWSKLAINCAITSLGVLGGDRLGPLLRKRFVRRLALEVMTETVAVAQAEGVQLEKVSGTLDLGWIALTDSERRTSVGSPGLFAKHTVLLAVGARYRRLRSSMLRAIERGRTPATDFLNGEVSRRGRQHEIATPINDAICEEVQRIAANKARSSHELLRAFFDKTSHVRGASASMAPPQPDSTPPASDSAPPVSGVTPPTADSAADSEPQPVAATKADSGSDPSTNSEVAREAAAPSSSDLEADPKPEPESL